MKAGGLSVHSSSLDAVMVPSRCTLLDDVVEPVVAERFNDALTGAAALGELPDQAEGRDEHQDPLPEQFVALTDHKDEQAVDGRDAGGSPASLGTGTEEVEGNRATAASFDKPAVTTFADAPINVRSPEAGAKRESPNHRLQRDVEVGRQLKHHRNHGGRVVMLSMNQRERHQRTTHRCRQLECIKGTDIW